MEDNKEISPLIPHAITPGEMLNSAIAHGIDAEGIKMLAEVFERMEAIRSEKLFTQALIAFQQDCPRILKTEEGVHRAKYAPIDTIKDAVDPVLWRHGFVATWDTQIHETKKQITSTCTLRHIEGHKETATFTAPIDPAPGMKDMHAAASAVSFSERYALQAVLGISPRKADDDGKRATAGPITAEQRAILEALLKETDSDNQAFWNFCGVQRLDDLPAADFGKINQALLTRKKRMAEAKKGAPREALRRPSGK